ncbi:hypothetical protein Sez_0474 [Streptococcus equi subsp. zooepidemicus MGCS10565]|uniref:Uncharacterized protein n=1 Tax=Streptococcus equi subsp. zooepidemicus (strain MGCS10565) TaxID=552526 RepID=B4U1H9_STREM|nr:hypothetical protein Sez_0474 [Streptococcus equi subsp. zooepidemicus MGCS10565]
MLPKPACLINGLLKRVKKAGAAWAQLFCSLEGFNLYELLFYWNCSFIGTALGIIGY